MVLPTSPLMGNAPHFEYPKQGEFMIFNGGRPRLAPRRARAENDAPNAASWGAIGHRHGDGGARTLPPLSHVPVPPIHYPRLTPLSVCV